ncbi:unnamed protein product [Zymoseptoria tritici ST99CH_1A5]|uniref:Uncharacterized protein n=1 Tax=Zymoseptoria tritici ST99CH_1A5 TaxID=1276529 RepID=A0A1Y6LEC0_ZYMTR|nr:unnamed protein product [Zymoseptoria tritici ST99CH_3D1]SMY21710.1 unnamed protein product [Zymoseptoria tritici ST99CH_1A5]
MLPSSSKTLLLALLLTTLLLLTQPTTVHALPKSKPKSIPSNTQTCKTHDQGYGILSYDVRIGHPYSAEKCLEVRKGLKAAHAGVREFKCKEIAGAPGGPGGPGGHVRLTFEISGGGKRKINEALDEAFPIIASGAGGFRCRGR